jgi:ABC-type lipoprotein release transport system permease subunit
MSAEKTGERQVSLPLSKAVEISYRNMRARLGRTLITSGGIVLGIAFLMYVVSSQQMLMALLEHGPEDVTASLAVPGDEAKAQQIWLITLSLLVAGVAISNAMLMAVTERYREIGTMKCLGALDSFVVKMFLMESAFQGLVGSVVGAVTGLILGVLIAMVRYGLVVLSVLPWGSMLVYAGVALVVGVVLAVISAIYPTYVAAKMVPADALRSEI